MQPIAIKSEDEMLQEQVRRLAQEVLSEISELEPSRSKEILGAFVSELFLSVAEQERRQMRRERQAEGIAAAKARGVRFGRPKKELPEDFDELYVAWRRGELTGDELAQRCDMAVGVLYRKLRERGYRVKEMPRARRESN